MYVCIHEINDAKIHTMYLRRQKNMIILKSKSKIIFCPLKNLIVVPYKENNQSNHKTNQWCAKQRIQCITFTAIQE